MRSLAQIERSVDAAQARSHAATLAAIDPTTQNLNAAQLADQRAIYDAAQVIPWGATSNSIDRETARKNEIMCRTVWNATETRDRSETGGGSWACAQWGALVMVLCILALAAIIILWPA